MNTITEGISSNEKLGKWNKRWTCEPQLTHQSHVWIMRCCIWVLLPRPAKLQIAKITNYRWLVYNTCKYDVLFTEFNSLNPGVIQKVREVLLSEKDCLWWHWLVFQQSECKSSSGSSDSSLESTWLWGWLLLRLSKCQSMSSQTPVLVRPTCTSVPPPGQSYFTNLQCSWMWATLT